MRLELGSQFERMESLRPMRDSFQRLLTLLILASIVIHASSLNHHHRKRREAIDPSLEIPITEDDTSSSSDSVVIKAVDIPEESVTYEGSQVWRVLAKDEKAEYVSYLQETGGLFFLSIIAQYLFN